MYTYIMFSGRNIYVERTKKKDRYKYICADAVLEGSSVIKNRFNIDENKLLEIAEATNTSDIEIPKEVKIEPVSWEEFRNTGLLWWINRILHAFGHAICLEYDDNGQFVKAYPCRANYRGFSPHSEFTGFYKITKYLTEHVQDLFDDLDCTLEPNNGKDKIQGG